MRAFAIAVIAGALIAAPAGATVSFTKQWVGGSEFLFPAHLTTDSAGNVYVSDIAFNTSRVLKLDGSGALVGVVGGGEGSDPGQFNSNESVATDAAGNIYVVEFNGNRVQKFDSNGNLVLLWGKGVNASTGGDICTVASGDLCQPGSGSGAAGGFFHASGIATDPSGNVYVADGGNQRVQKFDSDGHFVLMLGKGVDQTSSGDLCTTASGHVCQAGTAGSANGQFSGPSGIATDSSSNVYVSDPGNDRIQKFDSSGAFTAKWGTTGAGPGQFNDLGDVAVGPSDNVYGVDFTNSNVQVFSPDGTFIRSFGKGVNHTTGGDTCTAASGDVCGAGSFGTGNGQLFGATGVAVDPAGNVYVGDQAPSIQVFNPSGVFARKMAINGSGGPYDAGLFYIDVATDSSGNVYTTDHDTSRIQTFDPFGASLNAWGTAGTAGGQVGGPAGTAVDSAGNVYVAEQDNNRVTKYDPNGNFVLTWGNHVDQTSNGDICTAASGDTCQAGTAGSGPGALDGPMGLTVDPSGNVLVADTGNDRIEGFSSSGAFLTQWGGHGSADGQFDTPTDVATDSLGEVYVADRDNDRVQRFNSAGTFLGSWGGAGSGPGQFQQPVSLTVDTQRNVYVVDSVNARVEVFRPTGTFVESWGSAGAGPGEFNGPSSIALGSAARTYVADAGNNRVEMFTESDTAAPQTTIDAGPTGPTKNPTPHFLFSSSEPSGALFECRVDGSSQDDYSPCSSGSPTSHLTDGLHRFDVRAIDTAGNVDATPASRGIKVDTHRPSSAASAPANARRSPFNVTYSASDPAPSTGLAAVELWARKPGQAGYSKVATDHTPTASRVFSYTPRAGAGTYRFYTRAKDKVGNYEMPPGVPPDASTVFSP